MSARELQRTIVRMLHDPAFRDRVVADPDAALAGLALTAHERALLARADARAWRLDPHRPWRVLTALIAELPVTVALVGAPQRLDRFFASDAFHQAIRERRALAEAFAAWLEGVVTTPAQRASLALESSFVAVRRAPAPPRADLDEAPPDLTDRADDDAATLVTSPRARALALPAGTLAAWEQLRARLGPDPVAALVAGLSLAPPRLGPGLEHVLVERPLDQPEPVAGFVQPELVALLVAASAPTSRAALIAHLGATDATDEEAREILASLVDEGLLTP